MSGTGTSSKDRLIECVPNFSEGRDLSVIQKISDAIEQVDGAKVLHTTSDWSHNRSVITFVAPYRTMADAAFACISRAADLIDLSVHSGVHPRMGATDVVPFVPLASQGSTMDQCIALANKVGKRVGDELGIPVYLYENAATDQKRRNLAYVRRGGYERIKEEIAVEPSRVPDYGPLSVHPRAGAIAIGARPFLVAYNVYIGSSAHLAEAKEIALAIRESGGGLTGLKALGLEVDGQAQVSMNLVNLEQTSLKAAFDAVLEQAALRSLEVEWSEIIGLVPESMNFESATRYLRLRDSIEDHILERRLLDSK